MTPAPGVALAGAGWTSWNVHRVVVRHAPTGRRASAMLLAIPRKEVVVPEFLLAVLSEAVGAALVALLLAAGRRLLRTAARATP